MQTDTDHARDLAATLRSRAAPLANAGWELDNALHKLTVANTNGTRQEIDFARFAVFEAAKNAKAVLQALDYR